MGATKRLKTWYISMETFDLFGFDEGLVVFIQIKNILLASPSNIASVSE